MGKGEGRTGNMNGQLSHRVVTGVGRGVVALLCLLLLLLLSLYRRYSTRVASKHAIDRRDLSCGGWRWLAGLAFRTDPNGGFVGMVATPLVGIGVLSKENHATQDGWVAIKVCFDGTTDPFGVVASIVAAVIVVYSSSSSIG